MAEVLEILSSSSSSCSSSSSDDPSDEDSVVEHSERQVRPRLSLGVTKYWFTDSPEELEFSVFTIDSMRQVFEDENSLLYDLEGKYANHPNDDYRSPVKPTGLDNFGGSNYCYFNAVVQMIFSNAQLMEKLHAFLDTPDADEADHKYHCAEERKSASARKFPPPGTKKAPAAEEVTNTGVEVTDVDQLMEVVEVDDETPAGSSPTGLVNRKESNGPRLQAERFDTVVEHLVWLHREYVRSQKYFSLNLSMRPLSDNIPKKTLQTAKAFASFQRDALKRSLNLVRQVTAVRQRSFRRGVMNDAGEFYDFWMALIDDELKGISKSRGLTGQTKVGGKRKRSAPSEASDDGASAQPFSLKAEIGMVEKQKWMCRRVGCRNRNVECTNETDHWVFRLPLHGPMSNAKEMNKNGDFTFGNMVTTACIDRDERGMCAECETSIVIRNFFHEPPSPLSNTFIMELSWSQIPDRASITTLMEGVLEETFSIEQVMKGKTELEDQRTAAANSAEASQGEENALAITRRRGEEHGESADRHDDGVEETSHALARIRTIALFRGEHYTAVTRVANTNAWVHINDQVVTGRLAQWGDVVAFLKRERWAPLLISCDIARGSMPIHRVVVKPSTPVKPSPKHIAHDPKYQPTILEAIHNAAETTTTRFSHMVNSLVTSREKPSSPQQPQPPRPSAGNANSSPVDSVMEFSGIIDRTKAIRALQLAANRTNAEKDRITLAIELIVSGKADESPKKPATRSSGNVTEVPDVDGNAFLFGKVVGERRPQPRAARPSPAMMDMQRNRNAYQQQQQHDADDSTIITIDGQQRILTRSARSSLRGKTFSIFSKGTSRKFVGKILESRGAEVHLEHKSPKGINPKAYIVADKRAVLEILRGAEPTPKDNMAMVLKSVLMDPSRANYIVAATYLEAVNQDFDCNQADVLAQPTPKHQIKEVVEYHASPAKRKRHEQLSSEVNQGLSFARDSRKF